MVLRALFALLAVPAAALASTCPPDADLGAATGTDVAAGLTASTTCGSRNGFGTNVGDNVSCANGQNSPDFVYSWTAPSTHMYAIDTSGSGYDTALQLRSYVPGVDCGATELACNDDFQGLQSQILFNATAGTTYLIVVDGYSGTHCGDFVLNIAEYTCPDGDGDGVCDSNDLCFGNDATGDPDGDGVCTDNDLCFGNDSTGDSDADGICDSDDLCVGDDSAGDADGDGICDGPTLTLSVTGYAVGQTMTLTVDHAGYQGRLYVLASLAGPGYGPCYPGARVEGCVDLIDPRIIARALPTTGAQTVLTVPAPAWLRPGTPMAFQAILADPAEPRLAKSIPSVLFAQ